MSRLAKKPIQLPSGVEVKLEDKKVSAKGPKGTLTLDLPAGVTFSLAGQELDIAIDEKLIKRPFMGLYRALANNIIVGVSTGFQKKLTLIGVGYRAQTSGNKLSISLGFSHPVEFEIPEGISVKVDKSTSITIEGVDKQLVGQFAADIRAKRPPEPYKGKGVRYENEYVRKKAGKTAK